MKCESSEGLVLVLPLNRSARGRKKVAVELMISNAGGLFPERLLIALLMLIRFTVS